MRAGNPCAEPDAPPAGRSGYTRMCANGACQGVYDSGCLQEGPDGDGERVPGGVGFWPVDGRVRLVSI